MKGLINEMKGVRNEYSLSIEDKQPSRNVMLITAPAQHYDDLIDREEGMRKKCTHLL